MKAVVFAGLASLVAADSERGSNSLRGTGPVMIQKKGTGLVFDRRLGGDSHRKDEYGRRGAHGRDTKGFYQSKGKEYMGCYSDYQEDRVMGYKLTRSDMTTDICRTYCKKMNEGHMYYSTQWGVECWCGNSDVFQEYVRHGAGICDFKCGGDSEEFCGGHTAFDLYRFCEDEDESHDSSDSDDGPTPTPSNSEPSPQPAREPTPKPVQSGSPNNSGGMGTLLALHNEIRCMHGAKELSYSNTIAVTAENHAKFLTDSDNCGNIFHSKDSGYGENLFICGSSDLTFDCYDPAMAMNGLYDEEVGSGAVTTYGGHATQILWKDTTKVGCGLASCNTNGWRYNVLVCNFDPPGNRWGKTEEEVEKPSKSAAQCGYNNQYSEKHH